MGETDRRSELVESVRPWAPLILRYARESGLAPSLVGAVVAQESSGVMWAVRGEPGFFARYRAGISSLFARTAGKHDDHWLKTWPELTSASWGLMQVLYVVAVEIDPSVAYLRFPTQLLEPETNLRLGCAKLRQCIARKNGNLRAGLLAYNGGGNPKYPDEVLHKQAALEVSGKELGW